MNEIIHRKCHNHENREAVAQCPECEKFFCRECITEYDDRILCTRCLDKIIHASKIKTSRLSTLFRSTGALFGILILWLAFYYLGRIIVSIPADFHEGAIWSDGMVD